MPIMPDHAQARRCRIGIDLLPKLLGAADPWSDKESQSDYWLGSARSTPDELTRGKQQKIRLLFGHEYRYSWTSIITSESCPFLHCLAAQWFNIQLNNTATMAHPQQWHDSESPCNSCKRQIHDSRQETAGGSKSKFPRGGNLIKKSRVYRNEARPPGCQSRCLRQLSWGLFSWHPFLLAILCAPPFVWMPPPRNISFSWHPFPWCLHFLLIRFALDISCSWRPDTLFSPDNIFLVSPPSLDVSFLWHRSPDTFCSSHPLPVDKCFSWHLCTLFSGDPCVLKKTGSFWRLFPWPAFPWTTFSRHPLPLEPMFPERKLWHTDAFKKLYTQKPWLAERFYTEKFVCTRAFTHYVFAQRHFYTRELVHAKDLRTRKAFTRRSFYAQATFTHRKLLHVESFRAQKLVHKVALAHSKLLLVHAEVFSRWKLLRKRFYRDFFTHRELLHTGASTRRHTDTRKAFTSRSSYTGKDYTQKPSHTQKALTHRSFYAHKGLTPRCFCTQTAFTQRRLPHNDSFCTQKLWHTEALSHAKLSPSEASTQISFYTVTGTFTCRCFYTEDLVQTSFYMQKLVHTEGFTGESFWQQKLPPQNRNLGTKSKKGTILKQFVEWTLQGHWWAPRTEKKQHFKILSATLTRPAKTIYDGQLQNTTERNLDAAINPRSPSPMAQRSQSWRTWLQLWHGRRVQAHSIASCAGRANQALCNS